MPYRGILRLGLAKPPIGERVNSPGPTLFAARPRVSPRRGATAWPESPPDGRECLPAWRSSARYCGRRTPDSPQARLARRASHPELSQIRPSYCALYVRFLGRIERAAALSVSTPKAGGRGEFRGGKRRVGKGACCAVPMRIFTGMTNDAWARFALSTLRAGT